MLDESWKSLEMAILLYGWRAIFSAIGSSVEHCIGSAYILHMSGDSGYCHDGSDYGWTNGL